MRGTDGRQTCDQKRADGTLNLPVWFLRNRCPGSRHHLAMNLYIYSASFSENNHFEKTYFPLCLQQDLQGEKTDLELVFIMPFSVLGSVCWTNSTIISLKICVYSAPVGPLQCPAPGRAHRTIQQIHCAKAVHLLKAKTHIFPNLFLSPYSFPIQDPPL